MPIASPDHPVVVRLMEDYSRQFHGATPLESGTVEYERRKAVGALEAAGFRIVFPPAETPIAPSWAARAGEPCLVALAEAIDQSDPGALGTDRAAQVSDQLEELGYVLGEAAAVVKTVQELETLMEQGASRLRSGHWPSPPPWHHTASTGEVAAAVLDQVAAIVGVPGPTELAARPEESTP